MDKVVIEASVAVKWFVVEPYSNEARRVLDYLSERQSFLSRARSTSLQVRKHYLEETAISGPGRS